MKNSKVAYFCMEYGLHESFKIYSGGLGILAGDHLKASKQCGVPLVGIGILWQNGYTDQFVKDGYPQDSYTKMCYPFLQDMKAYVTVGGRGKEIKLKIWKCEQFDNVPLYLLDSDLEENGELRNICYSLYGGTTDDRILQEVILGIGGVRAIRTLGLEIDVYHFNEGHACLAGIEILREKVEYGVPFTKALEETKQQCVFTTHTPVRAGNAEYNHKALQYNGGYSIFDYNLMNWLGGDPFSQTLCALRLTRSCNAVAKLHGVVSREMWGGYDRIPTITHVTNGVDNLTWQDECIRHICLQPVYMVEGIVDIKTEKEKLWTAHQECKNLLFNKINDLYNVKLDTNILTIGFARRMTPYKRCDLILRNEALLDKLLSEKKIQIIFSGKAHPKDFAGKDVIAKLYNISLKYPSQVIFIQNYNMEIGKLITRGCDVWLNNPVRPMEACGTSGMKSAMNGVVNISIMDGWVDEWCIDGVNGWQIGNGYQGEGQDENDIASLYEVLQNKVLSTYQDREKWLEMMAQSVTTTEWQFSANRMITEYSRCIYNK